MSEEGPLAASIDDVFIANQMADKTRTFFVGGEHRLGFMALSAVIEYSFFHPVKGPTHNDFFHFFVINFFGIEHRMFSVPQEFEQRVVEIAQTLKLRPQLGAPVMVMPNGDIKHFPGTAEASKGRKNLYGIGGGGGAQAYRDRRLWRQIRQRESEIVDLFMEHGPIMTPEQVADRLWRLN